MPPSLIFDISGIDLNHVLYDQEAVREINPQRGDMEQLNGVIWADPATGCIVGFKDVKPDEFWVPGHIPGRPLYPGVMQIELAAQLASFHVKKHLGIKGFFGFGACESVKFRMQVLPGVRLIVLSKQLYYRHGRVASDVQGLVNGQLAFEARIVGVEM